MTLTQDRIIKARLQEGQSYQVRRRYVEKDKDYKQRFRDPSLAYGGPMDENEDGDGGSLADDKPEGNIPYVATNVRTKGASICYVEPDLYVETEDPSLSNIPKVALVQLWKNRNWTRITERAWFNRAITGMGVCCVYWNDPAPGKYGGPRVEFVRIADFIVDPHVTDWTYLRWAARRVKLPRDEARERWPDVEEFGSNDTSDPRSDAKKSSAVDIWVYWDMFTEAYMFGVKVLEKGENLYERVPIVVLEGDLDLSSQWSTGDLDATVGLQQMATKSDDMMNNTSKYGHSILMWNPDAITDDDTVRALENGVLNGLIKVEGGNFEAAMKYLSPEPLSPVVPMQQEKMVNGIDAAQGVNDLARGVITSDPKFATQVGAMEGQSGARGSKAQDEYEQFCTRITQLVVQWLVKFGKPQTPEEFSVMEALEQITTIYTIKGSTSYRNPVAQQQSSERLLQLFVPIAQLIGMNLRPLAEKVLRAHGEQDMNQFFGPPMPMGMPGQAEMQPGVPGQQPPTLQAAGSGGGGVEPSSSQPPLSIA